MWNLKCEVTSAKAKSTWKMTGVFFHIHITFSLPSTSSLWFIENECVANDRATIVTDTSSNATGSDTVNLTTSICLYLSLACEAGAAIFGRKLEFSIVCVSISYLDSDCAWEFHV
ncbi:hypothetical protein Dsin_003637 [Dipteronia sinensis]|uniref:Uncharacterized protein n=1 Tax=Dipteronia sinensis TaxID=43782 RepID=A0AAE0EKJ1_9ROSI|nr:hypothetical protein Dsin_003637 [Dipteronia sinensis]